MNALAPGSRLERSKKTLMMKGFGSALLSFTLVTSAAAQPPFTAQSELPYRFAGYSTEGFNNFVLWDLHAACQADFGDDARTCFMDEFLRSLNIDAPPSVFGWIMADDVLDFCAGVFKSGELSANIGCATGTAPPQPATCCVPAEP